MTMRLWSVVGLLVAFSGCSAAWRAAKAGQEALDRGDVEGAMAHYASACKQSEDKDWCDRADRLYADVKAQLIVEAQPLCGPRGKERQCLDVVNRARRIKDDPQLAGLADAAGSSWLAACQTIAVNVAVDAVVRVRCMEALRAEVSTPSYAQQVDSERSSLAAFVVTHAEAARQKRLSATTNGLLSLATCFSPPSVNVATIDDTRRELASKLVVRATLAADGLLSVQGACADVSQLSSGRIQCVDSGGEVGLRLGLARSEVSHTFNDTQHEVTYVARRERYENPEWRRLDRYRIDLERNARNARQNAQLADNNCDQARRDWSRANSCSNCDAQRTKEQYCRHANTLEDFSRQANRELNDAEYRQRQVPRELVREYTDVYRYVRRQHVWQQNFRIALVGAGGGFQPSDKVLTLSRTGIEQDGFDLAGVERHVAYPPSQNDLDAEAFTELRAELQPWLRNALEQNARSKEVTCPKPSESAESAFECQTSVAFLRGVEPSQYFLEAIGRAADQKAKYPALTCARAK